MGYKLISEPKAITDAFDRFARALGVPTLYGRKDHDEFRAFRKPRGERDCIELKWIGHTGYVLISACPEGTSTTKALVVANERGRKYLAHPGDFARNARDRDELFRANTRGDAESWIEVDEQGVPSQKYLITPLEGIDDAKIVANVGRFVRKCFVPNSNAVAPMIDHSMSDLPPLNRVFFGPPGTGKTFDAVSEAVKIIDPTDDYEDRTLLTRRLNELLDEGRMEFVTFHQNYAYEDFIEGIRPVLDEDQDKLRYVLRDGIFKQIAESASQDPKRPYVLIIDEINRGNIAKIFGELITLIEPSKRLRPQSAESRPDRQDMGSDELRTKLPYSQDRFGVPNNLYLIGTMNTADRGTALLDVALRRRFDFVERMPNPDHVGVAEDIEGVNGRTLLRVINGRIVEKLDREHQIGHTYLLGVKTLEALKRAFQNRVVPLLQEYFYDDWEKMRGVLNDNAFITRPKGVERPVFDVLPPDDDLWLDAKEYLKIYSSDATDGE